MTVGDKTITTLMWIKQLSTTTSHTIAEKVNTFMSGSLVRRHTLIAIAIWMLLNLTTVFLFQTQIDNTREAFYNRGVNLILRVAGKSGAPILSSDLLELNVAIREMMEMPETQFAAITDHQGKILAHSASARIGGEVAKLDGESPLETIRGVQIVSGRLREGMPIILFRSDVTYAGVRIGGVSIGWKGRNLATQLHALRWNMFLLMGISAVIIAVILFFCGTDHPYSQAQAGASHAGYDPYRALCIDAQNRSGWDGGALSGRLSAGGWIPQDGGGKKGASPSGR